MLIIILKSIDETRTLMCHKQLARWWNPDLKNKFSYCHRLMTFRIVSFHCSKEACQQLSEIAYCSLLKQLAVPSLHSCFSWTVNFYRFLWSRKALCYLVHHVKHFKHVPCVQTTQCRKCFAENWTCTTISQEIDHNSKSIYPHTK